MTGPTSLPMPEEPPRGLVADLLGLLASLGRHLQGLAALAGLETKEAAVIYLKAIAVAVAALVLIFLGYVLLLFFVAFLLAAVFGIQWLWISLGLGVLHLLGAGLCLFYVRSAFRQPVFRATSEEFKKDFAALKNVKP